jgi:hypothetical protein
VCLCRSADRDAGRYRSAGRDAGRYWSAGRDAGRYWSAGRDAVRTDGLPGSAGIRIRQVRDSRHAICKQICGGREQKR